MDRYARGAAPMGCAHSTGRKPGRAGSSWFLSLRLRLAINVFSCIFSNGVTRNAPVSHKLMCRWSYPLYIYLTDVHPRNTYPHVPIQQGCRDILSSPDGADIGTVPSLPPGGVMKTDIEAVPSLPPGGVTNTDIEAVPSIPLEA